MAKTFVDFGYSVDVISAADADGFMPEKKYAFYIGHRYNFVRIAQRLNADCVKVLHCDMAHPLLITLRICPGCSRSSREGHYFARDSDSIRLLRRSSMLTVPWSWEINSRSVLIAMRTSRSITCLSPRRLFIPGRNGKTLKLLEELSLVR